ncbi:MAG: gliding motility-associated C-terminal domain-containing protein [Bacteroidota bacterium]
MKQRFLWTVIAFCLTHMLIHPLHSQQFVNSSFEILGPIVEQPGPPWSFYLPRSSPDLQPGQFGIKRKAQHGRKFAGIVFRPDSSTEYLRQYLTQPLLPQTDYYFTIWLCYSERYNPWGGHPARLRFLGRKNLIDPLQLLWSSPIIDHEDWRQYHIHFKTSNLPLIDFFFQAYFSSPEYTNGGVLIDNIGLIQEGRLPQIDLGPDTILCEGESLTLPLEYDGFSTLIWQDGRSEQQIEVREAGTYVLTASTDILTISDTIKVEYTKIPDVDLGSDTSLCAGLELELSAEVDDSEVQYIWENGSTDPNRTIQEMGNYQIRLQKGRCQQMDSIYLQFRDCELVLKMPNVISPNGDGINERFIPIEIKDVFSPELRVYDRWGMQMYAATNLDQGWKGEAPYGPAKEGTYFWILTYQDGYGNEFVDKGSLTLLR